MSNQPEQFMTQGELAFRWKVSEATLERDRSLKQGCPYMKLGGLIRYRLQDVIGYENECTRQPSKPKPKKVNKPLDSEVILSTARASITRIYQDEWVARDQDVLDFARAIERAHGITGEQHE